MNNDLAAQAIAAMNTSSPQALEDEQLEALFMPPGERNREISLPYPAVWMDYTEQLLGLPDAERMQEIKCSLTALLKRTKSELVRRTVNEALQSRTLGCVV